MLLRLFFLGVGICIFFNGYSQNNSKPIAIVIHGGAGTILKENMTDSLEKAYRAKLAEALTEGYGVLDKGGSSLEAVRTAIHILENSPFFNAAKGAVFTNEGKNELDASVMEGENRNAGAVAGVTRVKNPIDAAIAVMQQSKHVMMAGDGADKFADEQGLEMVDPSYFYTERRYKQLQKAINAEKQQGYYDAYPYQDFKYGTVGAVAIDKAGNIVAATSTGGMTNKRFGRIGDSPIVGAGTYADNETCGISATGHGEYFIRSVAAYDVSALMKYKGYSIQKAGSEVIDKIAEMGGKGGLIGLDKDANILFTFSTEGMYRGYIKEGTDAVVLIYGDE